MPLSSEMLRLQSKWQAGTGWPKRLEWIEIKNLRGWAGQRFDLRFPIMAVVGENGSGKSTVLQCAASVYRDAVERESHYAFQFFPDTTWERITNASISYSVREGDARFQDSIRRPKPRWRGNTKRRVRNVEYIDLSRIQPVSARVGFSRLAKPLREDRTIAFDASRLKRFSQIMGREYDVAKMSTTHIDSVREIPVVSRHGIVYSGFHQGGGETAMVELLRADLPKYSLVLIDEIETSLHPRAQRRLMRDLADRCRELELQVIVTTHSPYVLDELPVEARAQIVQTGLRGDRTVFYGVSKEFSMTKMDDVPQYECDVYVEDARAGILLTEILAAKIPSAVTKCRIVPFGAASVGKALGQMVAEARFPRPSVVFLDGDQGHALGCNNLPGVDSPERLVFSQLQALNWVAIDRRVGRDFADVADACSQAMSFANHHEWVKHAATRLVLGGDILWTAMCAEWAKHCLPDHEAKKVVGPILDVVSGEATPSLSSNALGLLFEQSADE